MRSNLIEEVDRAQQAKQVPASLSCWHFKNKIHIRRKIALHKKNLFLPEIT